MTIQHVPVDGGALAYELVPGETEPVLAIHGLSSHRHLWDWLHAVAPELTLVTPDLRGRGDSIEVGAPFGLDRHVADMIAVLDAAGIASAHVCGMSMGGFIAVRLAVAHPERVTSLVLVDGGFPMTPPPGTTPESMPQLFADRLGRLEHVWDGVDAYLDHMVSQTAPMLDRDDPLLRGYLEHDLADGRVRLSADALVADAIDVFFGVNPWTALSVPTRFLHAEYGAGRGSPPAYPPELIEQVRPALTEIELIAGVDHAGSIMTPAGAKASADMITRALRS